VTVNGAWAIILGRSVVLEEKPQMETYVVICQQKYRSHIGLVVEFPTKIAVAFEAKCTLGTQLIRCSVLHSLT
jgi:hypothetical protein